MKRIEIVIGIDPGLKGAVCTMNEKGEVIEIEKMPLRKDKKKERNELDNEAIYKNLKEKKEKYKIKGIVIEKQQVRQGQGISSNGKTMMQYGVLLGIVEFIECPIYTVSPQRWQKYIKSICPLEKEELKEYQNKYNYKDSKLISIHYVEKTYGKDRRYLYSSSRQKKPLDGFADAIAITKYCLEELIEAVK